MDRAAGSQGRSLVVFGAVAVGGGWIINRTGLELYDRGLPENGTLGLVVFWCGAAVVLAGLAALAVGLVKIAKSTGSSAVRAIAWSCVGGIALLVVLPVLAILALALATLPDG